MRFVDPAFAYLKIAGFVGLQASLAALVGISLWAVFRGGPKSGYDAETKRSGEESGV